MFLRSVDQKLKDSIAKLSIPKIKEPHLDLEITTEFPISEFDPSKLKLELVSEDEYINTNFELERDSVNPLILTKIDLLEN